MNFIKDRFFLYVVVLNENLFEVGILGVCWISSLVC